VVEAVQEDIRRLDSRAVEASVRVVAQTHPDDLARPTPCAGWTLGDLLSHMTVQHHGFAAASEGRGADPEIWRVRPSADDPVRAYAESAERVVAAFADNAALDREFALPEISTQVTFPATQAIGFHFIDYVVHGWDVARALDIPYSLDADLVQAALPIARAVPGGERRLAPGAAFAPSVTGPDATEPLDLVLSLLGRSPRWPR
jgi:uncharacterized protein (TIGR03086 family)